jgi:hypothetical protein
MKFLLVVLMLSGPLPSFLVARAEKPSQLFDKGVETFKIVNEQSKTPSFRILNSSTAKKSFAVAVNSLLNLPNHPYVDIELQKLILRPISDQPLMVAMFLIASGKEYRVEPNLKKADLLSEKYIDIKVPTETSSVAVFNVSTKGTLTLKYNAKDDVLLIQNVHASFDIESPISERETEQVNFSGRGLRQK